MSICMEVKVGMRNRVLVDADAVVSLVIKSDNGHDWAVRESKKLLKNKDMLLYLTNFAYGEIITVISMKMDLKVAVKVARQIVKDDYVLIDVDEKLRQKGLEWFAKQTNKNSRFTDCVNMAVMEKYGIERVFSRDVHYKKNGFVRLGLDG